MESQSPAAVAFTTVRGGPVAAADGEHHTLATALTEAVAEPALTAVGTAGWGCRVAGSVSSNNAHGTNSDSNFRGDMGCVCGAVLT